MKYSAHKAVPGDPCKPNGSPVLGRPGGSGCGWLEVKLSRPQGALANQRQGIVIDQVSPQRSMHVRLVKPRFIWGAYNVFYIRDTHFISLCDVIVGSF